MTSLLRSTFLFAIAFLTYFAAEAQFDSPVKWKVTALQISDDTYEIRLNARIADKHYIYSTDIPEDEGPVATSVNIQKSKDIEVKDGLTYEGKLIVDFDPTFGIDIGKFKKEVTFIKVVKLLQDEVTIKGSYEFMACDEKQCFPPDEVEFSLKLKRKILQKEDDTAGTAAVIEASTEEPEIGDIPNDSLAKTIAFNWDAMDKDCVSADSDEADMSVWWIFILGFGGGLLALLTPCVFPMVPITVGFFTKGGRNRKEGVIQAMIYGFSIIVIYVFLGVATTMIFGADALNAMSTSAFFNVLFFLIFIIFAISFFGAFEITLPNSWANQSDKMAGRGGLVGIFFMAFTLALVSFSCTGPIIGSLLVQAATGQGPEIGILKVKPVMGMFGFSLALALPFTLFALFPQWLKSLPKSGGWMENVKINIGFLELALALKFLSVADLTQNWGFLRWEPFMAAWFIIFLLMGIYSTGIFSKTSRPILIRFFGVASILFSFYIGYAGLKYQPVAVLSGLAPPAHYNFFNEDIPHPSDFKNFDAAIAYAKEVNKPLLIDFTGDGCVNCRKMEEQVWIQADIKKLMSEYVIVSLYVDNREELPEADQYISSITGKSKKIKTVGHKWTDFEIRHFQKASQPYYVLITPDLDILTNPVAFTGETTYKNFLQCGLKRFKELQK